MVIARRIGLGQEFYLVDQVGRLSHAADEFLERCQAEAPRWGCNPDEFVPEFVESLVKINTPLTYTVSELVQAYLKNLRLAIQVGQEMKLRLYPLSSYPLAIEPLMREKINYHAQARTLSYERAAHAGKCAKTHLHLEAPPGSIDPRVGAAYCLTLQEQVELLNLYNLATALDPAMIALSRSCPFYEGQLSREASHVVRYRGNDPFEWEGVFTKVPIVGELRPYADSIETLVELQFARHYGWLAAMDQAQVDRLLFLNTGGGLLESAWNPVRLNALGTVEICSIDSNYPEMVLAIATLIERLATRVREEAWTVKPLRKAFCFELSGKTLLVPEFEFLNNILLYAAATTGISHPFVKEYIESALQLALDGDETNLALLHLKANLENEQTTESELFKEFSTNDQLSESVGLYLVRQCCDRLEKQVLSLSQAYSLTIPAVVEV